VTTSRRDKRLFARFDLDYADHPKIGDLSDAAFRAHVEMILYARKYMTDGNIPKRVANRFGFDSLSELCSNDLETPSLLKNDDGSYTLHGYADMNETREEIEKRSQVARENGKKGGRKPKQTGNQTGTQPLSEPGSETEPVSQAETETETEVTPNGVTPLTPQRGKKRGTRLDPSWIPPQALIDQMRNECPSVDLATEHKVFIDYWIAQPGQKGIKLDWEATWRNWMRRKHGDSNKRMTPTQRAQQTAAAGRQVAGMNITTFALEG